MYKFIFVLDVTKEILEVSVYDSKNILIRAYNSIDHPIQFNDLYETQSWIVRSLSAPNLEIDITKKLGPKDQPVVERNPKTNNYILYDQLERKGKDHALLIATDVYDNNFEFGKLNNPVRDAEALASDLENLYGFYCEVVRNPTKQQFLAILSKYKQKKCQTNEQLLIFISGHGSFEETTMDGYLVPKDGQSKSQDFGHISWISYTELKLNISDIKSDHVLLAIDACYSGAFQYAVAKLKSDDEDELELNLVTQGGGFVIECEVKLKYMLLLQ